MSFSAAITNLSEPQLREIIRLRRAVPLVLYLSANGKARQACALRHKGWMEHSTLFVNAMIIACHKTGVKDALDMATLLSATESYAIGLFARDDLTLEEHNLLIGCVALVATPEIIPTEQTWIPDPLPKQESITHQQYEALKEKDARRGRHSRSNSPDPDGDLAGTGIDATQALKALLGNKGKPKELEPVVSKVSKEDAINQMMQALKKKPEIAEERVRVEKGSGGEFQLVGISTGTVYAGPFPRPADAIVHASRNRLKLGIE